MTSHAAHAASPPWYLNETTLLDTLRDISRSRSAPPAIPGYDDFIELQRGGQGVVYAATQRSTRRKVAIKVLRDGALATDAAQRRFEREIELVASLNHPNIVRIYDSGISQPPDARAYFVMEFIDGVPLHEFIRAAGTHDRAPSLRLFVTICRAVSAAHQRGVIHRDLKPSNVRIDHTGEPHILDFGLAKGAENVGASIQLHHDTVSVAGQFLGSLPWASPEQAQGDPNAIDVRTDVYSLGVILYQLLTGRFPYDIDGSLRDVLERITATEPAPPSAVNRAINDELETIVLKCLAKEPDRRYQSAAELALDIERYLNGEPIQAKRDSAWYTMRKRLAQYRMLAAIAAVLFITLIAGISATLWQARQASLARDRAEQRFNDVRELARHVLFDLHDHIVNLPGSRPARQALVTTALLYLEELNADSHNDPALVAELAEGYLRIGDLQGRPNAPNLGDITAALRSYQKASDLASMLAKHPAEGPRATLLLIDIHAAIADVLAAQGSFDRAISNARASLELATQTMASHPGDHTALLRAAVAHVKLGDVLGNPSFANAGRIDDASTEYASAETVMQRLVRAQPNDLDTRRYLALVDERLGTMHDVRGEKSLALQRFEQSLALRKQLVSEQRENASLLRDLAIAHEKRANVLRAVGRLDDAARSYAEASAVFDSLVQIDPANVAARRNSAINHERIGDLHLDMGNAPAAERSIRISCDMFVDLARRDPGNEQAQFMAAVGKIKLADVLGNPDFLNLGQPERAIPLYREALDTFTALSNDAPDHRGRRRYLALTCERLGTMSLVTSNAADARMMFTRSRDLRVQLAQEDSAESDVVRDLGVAHEKLGKVFEFEQNYAAAIEHYRSAIDVYTRLAQQFPEAQQFSNDLVVAQQHIDRCTALAASLHN